VANAVENHALANLEVRFHVLHNFVRAHLDVLLPAYDEQRQPALASLEQGLWVLRPAEAETARQRREFARGADPRDEIVLRDSGEPGRRNERPAERDAALGCDRRV
jgi:hypothetical protein